MIRKILLTTLLLLSLILTGQAFAAADKYGGTFRVGIEAATNLDPGFVTSPPDILIISQIYERLVDINNQYQGTPGLATEWSSPDGKVWTFKLRSDTKFSDGKAVTSKDVIWTFNRLRDPKIGTPVVSFYANIEKIETPDDATVVFTLKDTNPEFPLDTGEYHAGIIPDGTTDPQAKNIGSGAYMITQFLPEDRVVMAKNPHFNLKNKQGEALPFFEELHFIFSPDIPGQVEALRGGELDFVGMIPFELTEALISGPDTKLILGDENEQMVIHMRADAGHPASDPRVVQAFKLATNHDEIIAAVRPGLAVAGNSTPVGPPYVDYYLDKKPVYDPEKAKALLKDAGHEKMEITMHVPTWAQNSQIATVWAQQLAQVGIKANLKMVPSDVYYSDAPDNWLECEFGIGPWGTRATPVTYYNLAYVTGALWNGVHWSDKEFDEIATAIGKEMDKQKRIDLYKKSQEIFIERAPAISVWVQKACAASNAKVEDVTLGYAWITTRFWDGYFQK